MNHLTEDAEWLNDMTTSWVEVYKKSMTTLVLLRHIAATEPTTAPALVAHYTASTGWDITERALYRTLRRLSGQGLLVAAEVSVPRTGLKRKEFSLTREGREFLVRIEAACLAPGGSATSPDSSPR